MNMRNHVAALLVALSATAAVGEAAFPAALRGAGALALDAGEAVPVRDGGRPGGTAAWAAALGRLRDTSLVAESCVDPKCQGTHACWERNIEDKIACGSCIGQASCWPGWNGGRGNVGTGSCHGYLVCADINGDVGSDSCIDPNPNSMNPDHGTCLGFQGNIGSYSCHGVKACKWSRGGIGHHSCRGDEACGGMTGSVGFNSCNGAKACFNMNWNVGDHACNGDEECIDATGDIDDGTSCMRGTTGFTKVEKLFGNAIASSAVPLQDLQVGDRIVGLDATKSEVDDCEVVSVSNQGGATVYQNYTADHYVVSEDDANYLQQHGKGGLEEGEPTTVYQVLSSCPVVRDESGKLSSFSICGKVLYKGGPMPWSVYLKIHGIMFSIIKSTGVRDSSAFHDAAYATRHLPGLCVSGLDCAEHGNCTTFEAKMLAFANQELTAEAHAKVLAAFPEFGNASKEGSVSSVVSKGKSVVAAE